MRRWPLEFRAFVTFCCACHSERACSACFILSTFRLNSPFGFSSKTSGSGLHRLWMKRPVSSGARPKACCMGEYPLTNSRLLKTLTDSAKASSAVIVGSKITSFSIKTLRPCTACSHVPINQWASPGMTSKKIELSSQKRSSSWLRNAPAGSSLRVLGHPKYCIQPSRKYWIKSPALMVCFFPCLRIRATRKRDPSSIIQANSYSSWVWGWTNLPPSADTTENFGGRGSIEATCLELILCFSWQTEQVNRLAASITSGFAFRLSSAWTMLRTLPWPVAACNK